MRMYLLLLYMYAYVLLIYKVYTYIVKSFENR